MLLLLGQLIYTSSPKVGFQALTSAAIPFEIRQAFIDEIVHQYWDSYNSPSSGYRAVYLYRISADHTLFGWLYNNGVDDLGRSHVPYFICYYFAGLLQSVHLEAIFTCLSTGPIMLADRHCLPARLESIVIPNHKDYQPARLGIAIASQLQERSHLALQQGKLFKLFVTEESTENLQNFVELLDSSEILKELTLPEVLSSMVGGKQSRIDSVMADGSKSFILNQSLEPLAAETYQQILLTKIRNAPFQKQAELSPKSWRLAIAVGAISLIAVAFGSFYLFQLFSVVTVQPTTTVFNQNSAVRLENLTLAKPLIGHSDAVWSVILSPDGKTLISGSADQTIKTWNVETGKVKNTLSGHTNVIRSLALTPEGKTLISGSGDRTIKIWNLQTNQLIQTLEQESPVWSVAVSQDGQTLIGGSEDGILKIWHLPTGKLLQTIPAHASRIFSVAISPDGKTIATATRNRTLKIWNSQTGELLRTITGHADAVRALVFSPDGKTIASASWDKTLKLWNWQTGELTRTFVGHTSRVVAVTFSPDGQTLFSGSVDNTIKLWSIQNGKLLRTLSDHTDWILSVAINSQHLVSGSKDQTIRIWQFN